MATHEVKAYANNGATREKAPFLLSYIKKSSQQFAELVKDSSKEAGTTETEQRAILEGAFDYVQELEQESLTRIHLPGEMTVEPCGLGTLKAKNSAWDPKENSLVLTLRMGPKYRNALANVTPAIVTDVTVTKADIHRVFDVAEPVPTQIIYGQREFRIQGKKLFPKAVYFLNAALQRFDCTVVTESPDGQVYVARSNELLEPGDYKLVIETDAGDEGGVIQKPSKPVKYLKVTPPEPLIVIPEIGAKVMSVQPGASGKVRFGEKFRLVGEGLRQLAEGRGGIMSIDMTTDELTVEGDLEYDPDGRWIDVTLRNFEEIEAGEHTGNLNVNAEDAEGTSVGRSFTLTVVK